MADATELLIIRHAPVTVPGHLFGRTDVAADVSDRTLARRIAAALGRPDHLLTSPLRRARETARAIWPELTAETDPRLIEQDFGAWEGKPYAALPPLGENPRRTLANLAPPEGESFADLVRRVRPAMAEAAARGGRVAVVAHAGIARATLSLALGSDDAGLAFTIDNWSLTSVAAIRPEGPFAVRLVNWRPDARA